jgi:hypothetical protein
MPKLAAAAADRAREVLVMSFPNDRWWTRLGLTLANFGFRVIRMQFRVFLYPPELMLAAVEHQGFSTRLNQRGACYGKWPRSSGLPESGASRMTRSDCTRPGLDTLWG